MYIYGADFLKWIGCSRGGESAWLLAFTALGFHLLTSVTRLWRGSNRRPRRQEAGLHTGDEEAGPGPMDYERKPHGSVLSYSLLHQHRRPSIRHQCRRKFLGMQLYWCAPLFLPIKVACEAVTDSEIAWSGTHGPRSILKFLGQAHMDLMTQDDTISFNANHEFLLIVVEAQSLSLSCLCNYFIHM